jgi:hypothetical protein
MEEFDTGRFTLGNVLRVMRASSGLLGIWIVSTLIKGPTQEELLVPVNHFPHSHS